MHVTNITVGYDRKRQPAQYESAGAKIEFTASASATVGEDEDYVAVARLLLGQAKTLVLQELGIVPVGQSASASDRASAASTPVVEAGEPAKETAAAKKVRLAAEKAAEAAKTKVSDADIPGEDDKGKHTPILTTSTVADIPDGGSAPSTPAVADALTHQEVHLHVSNLVQAKKIDPKQVKEITGKFNAPRIADLPLDKLKDYKASIDAKVSELGGDL